MRDLTARELIVATRCAAVPMAGLVSLAACLAFVLAWSPGVPWLAPLDLYAQTRAVHWILLAVVLPYAAVRSSPLDRLESIQLMAALNRTPPGAAVAAKILGAYGVVMIVILTGMPAMVLAQQAAAAPMSVVAADLLPLAGVALLVAATATGAVLIASDLVRAWLWTSGIVIGVMIAAVWWVPEIARLGLLCGVTGAAAAVSLSTLAGGARTSSGEAHGG